MELTLQDLGELLKKAREGKRTKDGKLISQRMIAEKIGVDRQSVSDWEVGRSHPGFLNVVKYCECVGITLDDLLGVKKKRLLHLLITEEEKKHLMELIDQAERDERIKEAATPLPEGVKPYSHICFVIECVKQLFSREVWEEVADERNAWFRQHPLSDLLPGRTPGETEQENES